jgi:hypothetical protein
MSERIRSLTLFTALLFAAACGGEAATTGSAGSAATAVPTTPVVTTPTVATTPPAAVCGNNKAEGAEPCDGTDLKGQTCASMNPGSMGVLMCKSCRLDTLMCLATTAAPMGGAGAAQGGSGARPMGSAGAGGSGRMRSDRQADLNVVERGSRESVVRVGA